MEIVGTSVRKSTEEDKARIKELMKEDPHIFEAIPPREMYRMLKDGEADIMLSGGRTQFIALKAKTPWLDINQERHNAYAGYDGMVELVRQLDLALHNPIWSQIRAPAPFDSKGRLTKAVRLADAVGEPDATPSQAFLRKFAGTEAQDLGEC